MNKKISQENSNEIIQCFCSKNKCYTSSIFFYLTIGRIRQIFFSMGRYIHSSTNYNENLSGLKSQKHSINVPSLLTTRIKNWKNAMASKTTIIFSTDIYRVNGFTLYVLKFSFLFRQTLNFHLRNLILLSKSKKEYQKT